MSEPPKQECIEHAALLRDLAQDLRTSSFSIEAKNKKQLKKHEGQAHYDFQVQQAEEEVEDLQQEAREVRELAKILRTGAIEEAASYAKSVDIDDTIKRFAKGTWKFLHKYS